VEEDLEKFFFRRGYGEVLIDISIKDVISVLRMYEKLACVRKRLQCRELVSTMSLSSKGNSSRGFRFQEIFSMNLNFSNQHPKYNFFREVNRISNFKYLKP
jgi:hypothetical protein